MPGKTQGAQLITSAFPAPEGSLCPVSISRTPASADYTNGMKDSFQIPTQTSINKVSFLVNFLGNSEYEAFSSY